MVNAIRWSAGCPRTAGTTGLQVGSDGEVVGGSGQLANAGRRAARTRCSAPGTTLDRLNRAEGRSRPTASTPGRAARAARGPTQDRAGDAVRYDDTAAADRTVASAVFGLAVALRGRRPALVPSWLYAVRQPGAGSGPDSASTVAHPAVNPKYLARRDGGDAQGPQSRHRKPSGNARGDDPASAYAVSDGGRKLTVALLGRGVQRLLGVGAEEDGATVNGRGRPRKDEEAGPGLHRRSPRRSPRR